LALVEDAVSSLQQNLPMESILHHMLNVVLRGELAAVEWRLCIKLAKYHEHKQFPDLFPTQHVGECAAVKVNRHPRPTWKSPRRM